MTDYDFKTLSSGDFELFVGDLLNAELGLDLHGFPAGRDGGVDLRDDLSDGSVVIVQCKHYANSTIDKLIREVRLEVKKPARSSASRYILATSQPLTSYREGQVVEILGIERDDVWGPGRLNAVLGKHEKVQRDHYKLWLNSTTVLTTIFQAGLWNRASAKLEDVADRGRYWVDVPGFAEARDSLARTGVCLVSGIAGVGKTLLAERLMLGALDEKWQVVDVADELDKVWELAETDEKRFYYYDDFLGDSQLRTDAGIKAPELKKFIRHVQRHKDRARLVLAARDQVLTQARDLPSDRLHDIIGETASVHLDLARISPSVRRNILLNHFHFSLLERPEYDRLAFEPLMNSLVQHPSFSPRLVQAVTEHLPSDATAVSALKNVLAAFDDPTSIWDTTFNALDDSEQEILFTLASFPSDRPVASAVLRRSAPPMRARDWRSAIDSLTPSWTRTAGSGDGRRFAFAHPGCRDYILSRLDDEDIAAEFITERLKHLEQLSGLAHAAGILTALPIRQPTRPQLAAVLNAHRRILAGRLETWWSEWTAQGERSIHVVLLRLREVTALCRIFGDADTTGWLVEEFRSLTDAEMADQIACVEGIAAVRELAAAADSRGLTCDTLISDLLVAAISHADSTRDLEACESLPDALNRDQVWETTRQRAALIMREELERALEDEVPLDEREDVLYELESRIARYGVDLDLDDLKDYIAVAHEAA
jgi:hypothetical protein